MHECDIPLVEMDSHHPPLCITTTFAEMNTLGTTSRIKYLYDEADFSTISNELNKIDWTSVLSTGSVDDATNTFYKILFDLRSSYIPSKITRPDNIYPPWYNTVLIKILKEKYKFHCKYKKYKNRSDYNSFVLLRDRAKVLERERYDNYIKNIENNIKKNPKHFWKYVKNKRQHNALPSVMIYNQQSSDSGGTICNMFASYFQSTFLQGSDVNLCCDELEPDSVVDVGSIEVPEEEVFKQLKSLDISKSAGPDHVPAVLIVQCAQSLSIPLTILFRRSLETGCVPVIWKSAFITPVHKKGPKNLVENYRPISKLCLFAKCFERIVYNQLYNSLRHTFNEQQHGFLKGRSTTSNLVLCSEYISEHMSTGHQIDVLNTDYSKAFDRIDHPLLLKKLQLAGIRGNLYRWFCSYIDNRTQTVALNGFTSFTIQIPSGVPQGSLLGPLLFTIFINDIPSCFYNSKILLYADDMKILCPISDHSGCLGLQQDLLRFEAYCLQNKLDLNVLKCFVCTYTRKREPLMFDYTLKQMSVARVHTIKDLGVMFDSKILFDAHVDNIVNKASKALGFVLRLSSEFSNIKTFKILYCAFVRSHLEYASQVWNPMYDVYIKRIENIQKRFLRYIEYRCHGHEQDYLSRCRKHHLLPLSNRRQIADIAYLLNIANGSVDCSELLGKLMLTTPMKNVRKPNLLHVPVTKSNYRGNSYMLRAGKLFNSVCGVHDIDLFCTSVSKFRNILSGDFFSC